jgi:hypothetical protein
MGRDAWKMLGEGRESDRVKYGVLLTDEGWHDVLSIESFVAACGFAASYVAKDVDGFYRLVETCYPGVRLDRSLSLAENAKRLRAGISSMPKAKRRERQTLVRRCANRIARGISGGQRDAKPDRRFVDLPVPKRPMSAEDIDRQRSPRGGWSRDILRRWGVPWPPPKGWRARLIQHGAPWRADEQPRTFAADDADGRDNLDRAFETAMQLDDRLDDRRSGG